MNEQEINNTAKVMAESFAQVARDMYTAEFAGKEITVQPQAFVFSEVPGSVGAVALPSDIVCSAFEGEHSGTRRAIIAKWISDEVEAGRYLFGIILSEARMTMIPENVPDGPDIRERAMVKEAIVLSLYLRGPTVLFGFAEIKNGKADPFQWTPIAEFAGNLVPPGAQGAQGSKQ